ncbi:MAG: isocitrate lyase/PEP mutase family protein [Bacteroidota bacterium]
MSSVSGAMQFRRLLKSGKMIVAPGVYDGITAKLTEQAGFCAAYMTGAGTSAAHGYPDFGLITMSEMVANARRITDAISIPLVSDIDTGYGNELNVYRTIEQFERAGVAAVHLEDQVFPKKCGHLEDKEVIPLDNYLAKIRAAAAARRSSDFTIIARTDSRAVLGFEEAVKRMNAAIEAGADMAFLEAPQTMAEVEAVPKRIKGPCLLNIVLGGKTPIIDMATAERLGYAIAIVPGLLTRTVIDACDAMLRQLKETGAPPPAGANKPVRQFFNRFGADEWDKRRTAYRGPAKQAAE